MIKITSTTSTLSIFDNVSQQQSTDKPFNNTHRNYVDTVTLSQQGLEAFQAEVMSNHQPGDVVAVADNRNKNIMATSRNEFMQLAIQATLDKRTGVDRDKLDEINAMMEDVANNPNLTEKQNEEMLAQLAAQKEEVIKDATERKIAEERKKEYDQTVKR